MSVSNIEGLVNKLVSYERILTIQLSKSEAYQSDNYLEIALLKGQIVEVENQLMEEVEHIHNRS